MTSSTHSSDQSPHNVAEKTHKILHLKPHLLHNTHGTKTWSLNPTQPKPYHLQPPKDDSTRRTPQHPKYTSTPEKRPRTSVLMCLGVRPSTSTTTGRDGHHGQPPRFLPCNELLKVRAGVISVRRLQALYMFAAGARSISPNY